MHSFENKKMLFFLSPNVLQSCPRFGFLSRIWGEQIYHVHRPWSSSLAFTLIPSVIYHPYLLFTINSTHVRKIKSPPLEFRRRVAAGLTDVLADGNTVEEGRSSQRYRLPGLSAPILLRRFINTTKPLPDTLEISKHEGRQSQKSCFVIY